MTMLVDPGNTVTPGAYSENGFAESSALRT